MDDDVKEHAGVALKEPSGSDEPAGPAPMTGAADEDKGAGEMDTTTTRTRKARKVRKTSGPRKARAKASGEGRTLKTYRLVNGIPDNIGDKTRAMALLLAIKKLGSGTRAQIVEELPRTFKAPTLGFYLGKFQHSKIITTKAAK